MSDTLTRTAAGTEIPEVGTYDIDPSHSTTEFQVRHLGLSKVRGRFASFSGRLVVADAPFDSSVEVSIDTASIDTGEADRDQHLRSPDFLDVEQYPVMVFESTGVRQDGDDWVVDGELTIKDVSKPVSLDVEFEGAGGDPWGNDRVAFTAATEIDREQWGLTWNQVLEGGGVLVGRKVKIEIDVQAVKQES